MSPNRIHSKELCDKVARLQTYVKNVKSGDRQEKSEHPIHSISLHSEYGSTSILAAHIKNLALIHDHQDAVLDPDFNCDVIDPAEAIEKLDLGFMRNKRFCNGNSSSGSKIGSSDAPVKKTAMVAPVKKSTNAADFFGKSSSLSSQNTYQASQPKQKDEIDIIEQPPEIRNINHDVVTKPGLSPKHVSKPVSSPKDINISTKGNADDFVGDEDEDDDFLEQEEERKKRVAKAEAQAEKVRRLKEKAADVDQIQQPKASKKESDMELEDTDNNSKIHGAIDAFAIKTAKSVSDQNQSQTGRKRRKQVLEEKSYVDEKGFFRTEMVTSWVEVDDDENDSAVEKSNVNPVHLKATSKPKATKGMKQQGLMGFFGKK